MSKSSFILGLVVGLVVAAVSLLLYEPRPPTTWLTVELPRDALTKLSGSAGIHNGRFTVEIYNGNDDWTVTEMVLSVIATRLPEVSTVFDEHGDDRSPPFVAIDPERVVDVPRLEWKDAEGPVAGALEEQQKSVRRRHRWTRQFHVTELIGPLTATESLIINMVELDGVYTSWSIESARGFRVTD